MLISSRKLEELGIVFYIEDLGYLERSFWAMLPGNFAFLNVSTCCSHDEIAAFATMGRDKFTAVDDCMFGEPVTFLKTTKAAPFRCIFSTTARAIF